MRGEFELTQYPPRQNTEKGLATPERQCVVNQFVEKIFPRLLHVCEDTFECKHTFQLCLMLGHVIHLRLLPRQNIFLLQRSAAFANVIKDESTHSVWESNDLVNHPSKCDI